MKAILRAALLLGLASAVPPAAQAADKVHLGKAVGIAWTFLPADVGVEKGLFARQGLDVDIVAFGGDAKLQQAMATGAVDFGLGSGPAMAFTVKGAPVIAVAAFAGAPRNISVVVPADSPIKTVADLKGKLLAVSTAGSLTEWLVKRIGVSEGWGPDGVRAAAIGDAPAQTAAMRAHQVDGYMGSTENGYQLEDLGEARVLVGMERFAPHFITHVIFARRDLVAKDPELVRRFLKGFFGAIAYIRAHKEETTKIAIAVEHESQSVLDKAYDHELPMMQTDGAFDPEGLALIKQSFVEMHTLDSAPPDDAILTRQFLPVVP